MRKLLLPLALLLTAPFASAQNCFDGNFGTLVGADIGDWVSPLQSFGFAFPLGGQTYTGFYVTDHGFITLSNGGTPPPPPQASVYAPTTANFAVGSPKVCALYADIVGNDTGQIFVRSTPQRCLITWVGMRNYGLTQLFDLQLALFPNGNFEITYGANVTNASIFGSPAENGICGVTPGNNVVLPASSDLSAGFASSNNSVFELWTTPNTFDLANNKLRFVATNPGYTVTVVGAPNNCAESTTYGSGCAGLRLAPAGLPTLGNTACSLRVHDIPAGSPLALIGFGTVVLNPGVPLGGVGMPGCTNYTNLDIGLFTSGAISGASSTFTLSVPNTPSLSGTILSAQGLAFSSSTPLGLVNSNGLRLRVGL